MKISVILAHPNNKSFNHAIARQAVDRLARNGHDVSFHDLYAENFDPVLTWPEMPVRVELPEAVRTHCSEIGAADGIVVVHPNWWGQPPAILKGWVDRIMRPEIAYRFREGDAGEGVPQGLLRAGAAVVLNTSNTPEARELEVFGDPLETLWKNCIFGLCGIDNFHRKNFAVMITSTPEQRKAWLLEVADAMDRWFPAA